MTSNDPHASNSPHSDASANTGGDTAHWRHSITGIAQWRETLLQCLAAAQEQACIRVVLCDPSFAQWPLSETDILEALQAWLHPQRQLVLVANEFDTIVRRHPRFVAWRQRWDVLVPGRKVIRQFAGETPSFVLAGTQAVWLTRPEFFTGVYGNDPLLVQQVAEQAGEWLESRSVNGFAANTLGL